MSLERRVLRSLFVKWSSSQRPFEQVLRLQFKESGLGPMERERLQSAAYRLLRNFPHLVGRFKPNDQLSLRQLQDAIDVVSAESDVLRIHHMGKPFVSEMNDSTSESVMIRHLERVHGLDFSAQMGDPQDWHRYLHQQMAEAPIAVWFPSNSDLRIRRASNFEATDLEGCFFYRGPRQQLEQWISDGLVVLQDLNSQRIMSRIQSLGGSRVLDLCCGAGGKALRWMALCPGLQVDCYDINPGKLQKFQDRAQRIGLDRFRILKEPPPVKDTELFYDVVLADVPCSGLGTLRRRPDLLLEFQQSQLPDLHRIQIGLLRQGAANVKPGGYLVYVTCTLSRCENESIIEELLNLDTSFSIDETTHCLGNRALGARLEPESSGGDGFYYCVLQRCRKIFV